MRIFLDTNIFIEYLERRIQFQYVRTILQSVVDGKNEAFVSAGSFYTITYAIDMGLKRMGVHNPDRLKKIREALLLVLGLAKVVSMPHDSFVSAVKNEEFSDIEDCFQYSCALSQLCDVIVTINSKDFKNADNNKVKVLTPEQFVEQYS